MPPKPPQASIRLEWVDPKTLTDNPQNWRTHPEAQMMALSEVIADPEIGWAGVLLFNERTGRLIDGHARKQLAVSRGEKRVPVIVGSWSEAAEKKILLTLDPIAAMADRDDVNLKSLLDDTDIPDALQFLVQDFGELDDGEAADTTIESRALNARENVGTVKAVISTESVEIVERAIRLTGMKERGKALTEICRKYCDAKGQLDGEAEDLTAENGLGALLESQDP